MGEASPVDLAVGSIIECCRLALHRESSHIGRDVPDPKRVGGTSGCRIDSKDESGARVVVADDAVVQEPLTASSAALKTGASPREKTNDGEEWRL